MNFSRNVFINCPFDPLYLPILKSVLFCLLSLGFAPRIALERLDSGETRIEKIIDLIVASKFGIHDLSRLRAKEVGEFFRLNMPFELGLDIGCRRFKGGRWGGKRCLILEAESYRYQAALSDLSNSDIAVHRNDPLEAMRQVRNWLSGAARIRDCPGPALIWNRFNDFTADNYASLVDNGHSAEDVESQPIEEVIRQMKTWIKASERTAPTRRASA